MEYNLWKKLKEYYYPGEDNSSIHLLNTYCWPSKFQIVLGGINSTINKANQGCNKTCILIKFFSTKRNELQMIGPIS